MRELEGALAGIKGRWMTGLAGAEAAPAQWKPHLGEGAEAELRLLALAGQAMQIGFAPAPSETLEPAPPLPSLALPVIADDARSRLRRLLTADKLTAEDMAPVLEMVEARGYSVHPSDWMPGSTDSFAPALYAPWIDWRNDGDRRDQEEAPNSENWDQWYPAERRTALAELRRRDPGAARALLEARAADVPAEERLRLIEVLSEGLSEADIPYLESLEKDRSGKVKVRAAQFLARLGATQTDAELVSELADMLALRRAKMLSASKSLGPKKLKNDAQHKRRIELFALVPLHAIAQVFEMTPRQAVETWNLTAHKQSSSAFAEMVATTGGDELQVILAKRLIEVGQYDALDPLIARLTPQDRRAMVDAALKIEGDKFRLALDLSRPLLGTLSLAEVKATPDVVSIPQVIAESAKAIDNQNWRADQIVGEKLRTLGLLVDQAAAGTLISDVVNSGLLSADPRLNMLHLNASLPPRS